MVDSLRWGVHEVHLDTIKRWSSLQYKGAQGYYKGFHSLSKARDWLHQQGTPSPWFKTFVDEDCFEILVQMGFLSSFDGNLDQVGCKST